MFNAIAKSYEDEMLFPKTLAENVIDKNGVKLESYIDLFMNEIKKREIKRFYLNLSDLDLTTETTTYEILEKMADNTIAFLSVENDDPLVTEIGARLGGILLLYKKTSIYFSAGFFITYRYGEVYYGCPGLGGESFSWSPSRQPIHSLHNGYTTTLSTVNEYEKITDWGGVSVNGRLSIEDGAVVIPKGVNHIMISGCVVLESVEAGLKYLHIFKNGQTTDISIKQSCATDDCQLTLTIPPILLESVEGDTFDLRVYSNSLDTLRMKHFTVEVID